MENGSASTFSPEEINGLTNLMTFMCCPAQLPDENSSKLALESKPLISGMPSDDKKHQN